MNQLQTNRQNQLVNLVQQMKPQLQMVLPKHVSSDKMVRVCLTSLRQNPKLMMCKPESFLGAMLQSASLGLEPNTPLGQAYLIPYKDECTLIVGYKGILDLAYRSGQYKNIFAMEVHQNDEFDFGYGLNPFLIHKPAKQSIGEPVFYYAVLKMINGGEGFLVFSREKIEAHGKKYSKNYNNGPWKTDFDAMAKKTVLKALLKTAPMTTEFADHMSKDGGIYQTSLSNNSLEIDMISHEDVEELAEREPPNENKEELQDYKKEDLNELIKKRQAQNSTNISVSKKEEKKNINENPFDELEEIDKNLNCDYKEKNSEIYNVIDNFLTHPKIKNNGKIKEKLLELQEKKLSKDDKPILVGSIRSALNNDFQAINSLLKLKVSI